MPDCNACKENRLATEPVPYIVHEAALARLERTVKRLWILALVAVALLVATNALWIWYEGQFQDESWTYEATTDNGGTAIASDGEVNYYGNGENNAPQTEP